MEIFRTFTHNGKSLQLAAYEPDAQPHPAVHRAPGTGDFTVESLSLSAAAIHPGDELTLTAQVSGENIAFIYTEILLRDPELEQFYGPVTQEYLRAGRDKETGEVTYPDWDATIAISSRIQPHLRLLTDGTDYAFCFSSPAGYTSSDTWLEGLYTSADGETLRRARLTFDADGMLTRAVAYKSRGGAHALRFQPDDQFAPFVQILTPPSAENPAWQATTGLSTSLTFRGQPFHWQPETLIPGNYLAGLLIQDLDGALTRRYAPLTISD
jgi:hypothetical protein